MLNIGTLSVRRCSDDNKTKTNSMTTSELDTASDNPLSEKHRYTSDNTKPILSNFEKAALDRVGSLQKKVDCCIPHKGYVHIKGILTIVFQNVSSLLLKFI